MAGTSRGEITKRRPGRSLAWHRGLDRRSVAAAALQILDEEGRPALTMRHLAASLEVEAASLYAHVASKDDLVDAVLDQVLDAVDLPEKGADIRSSLVLGFDSYRRKLVAHPSIVLLMTERARLSRSQLRLAERSIELLESAGLSTRAAVDAHVTLVAFVLGFVLQEVARPTTTPARVIATSPVLQRALSTLAERSVDQRFEVGLGLILDGVGVPRTDRR
jgi:AcrR family transcriptional regulator